MQYSAKFITPVQLGTGGFFILFSSDLYVIIYHIYYSIYFICLSRYNIVKEMIPWQRNCKSQRSLTSKVMTAIKLSLCESRKKQYRNLKKSHSRQIVPEMSLSISCLNSVLRTVKSKSKIIEVNSITSIFVFSDNVFPILKYAVIYHNQIYDVLCQNTLIKHLNAFCC